MGRALAGPVVGQTLLGLLQRQPGTRNGRLPLKVRHSPYAVKITAGGLGARRSNLVRGQPVLRRGDSPLWRMILAFHQSMFA